MLMQSITSKNITNNKHCSAIFMLELRFEEEIIIKIRIKMMYGIET